MGLRDFIKVKADNVDTKHVLEVFNKNCGMYPKLKESSVVMITADELGMRKSDLIDILEQAFAETETAPEK